MTEHQRCCKCVVPSGGLKSASAVGCLPAALMAVWLVVCGGVALTVNPPVKALRLDSGPIMDQNRGVDFGNVFVDPKAPASQRYKRTYLKGKPRDVDTAGIYIAGSGQLPAQGRHVGRQERCQPGRRSARATSLRHACREAIRVPVPLGQGAGLNRV